MTQSDSKSRRRNRRAVAALLGLCLVPAISLAADGDDEDARFVGPVPLRTISPLRLLFYQLPPESARILGHKQWKLGLQLSETNVLHIRNAPPTEFDADINVEITRLNLQFRYGISARWDIGVEMPLYRFHQGFLDSTVREVEDLFGDLKVQRVFEQEFQEPDAFRYILNRNGETFFAVPDEITGLGDIALTAKRTLTSQSGKRPALSLRAAVKLPTGDEDEAMSSGEIDLSAGLALDYAFTHWGINATLSGTFPLDGPFESVGLDTDPIVSAQLGFEYHRWKNWFLELQFAATSGPFSLASDRGEGLFMAQPSENFTGSIVEITPAVGRRFGSRYALYLGLTEDIQNTQGAAADLSLFAVLEIASH